MNLALSRLALALLFGTGTATVPQRPWIDPARCPLTTSLKALGSVASAPRDWKVLRGHFLLYGACDAGAVAEGYTEDVVGLLTQSWPLLPIWDGSPCATPPSSPSCSPTSTPRPHPRISPQCVVTR